MWVVFAVLARLCWAGTNAVDQVYSRDFPAKTILPALMLQLLCYTPFCAILWLVTDLSDLPITAAVHVVLGAVCFAAGLFPYLLVLQREEAHDVVPNLELTPVFLILMAWFFNGETMTWVQGLGAAMVIGAGFLFSWDFQKSHFKASAFMPTAVAAFMFAAQQYGFSQAEKYADPMTCILVFYLVLVIMGVGLSVIFQGSGATMLHVVRATKGRCVFLICGTIALEFIGLWAIMVAFGSAPTVGHVAALSGAQPIFSFLLAVPLGLYLPRLYQRIVFTRETWAKLGLIGVIVVGVYLLSRSF